MKEELAVPLFSICLLLAILLLINGAIRCNDNHAWNDGLHSCGGKWEFIEAIGHAHSTSYLYKCDKCGEYHEFRKFRKGEGND